MFPTTTRGGVEGEPRFPSWFPSRFPSSKSIATFFNVNGSLISISLTVYIAMHYTKDAYFLNKLFLTYCIYIARNYFMMFLLMQATKHKQFTNESNVNNDCNHQLTSHMYLFSTTFWDTVSGVFIYDRLMIHQSIYVTDITHSIIYFIPTSFLFELIMDFFHYWSHRILHLNKKLYVNIHKTHHRHTNPVIINTYYFSPLDVIGTITIPMALTVCLFPYKLSLFDYAMLSVYKQYTELSGHSGKMLEPGSSFPQFIWLPRMLNIQLYAEDHDLHHKVSNCNFAKRFSLWDKVFGTYVLHKPQTTNHK